MIKLYKKDSLFFEIASKRIMQAEKIGKEKFGRKFNE